MIHNNEHMDPDTYVYSDNDYDYCIINGESLTMYYGPVGGDYESIPLHMLVDIENLLTVDWVEELLRRDAEGPKLYKHWDKIAPYWEKT